MPGIIGGLARYTCPHCGTVVILPTTSTPSKQGASGVAVYDMTVDWTPLTEHLDTHTQDGR